ncbi:MAG: hypothetical protein JWM56_1162 [Candidatus Peribacteria bacterium]|nr:hypothetical protein [Candidatus Peribacteria bacterium]
MSNTHHHFLHKHLTIAALVIGILSLTSASNALLLAQLNSGGALVTNVTIAPTEQMLMPAPAFHASAGSNVASPVINDHEILAGMLMILLGFCLHLLFLQQAKRDPMMIRIHQLYPKRTPWSGVKHWYREAMDTPFHRHLS